MLKRMTVVVLSLIVLVGCGENALTAQDQQEAPEQIKAEPQEQLFPRVEIRDTQRRTLHSEIVGETYEIDIFLPQEYTTSGERYPVLYVFDAEYNFGAVSYITRRLIKNNEIPPVILVGIAYDTDYETFYNKRSRDLTPTVSSDSGDRGWESGGAARFADFLEQELIPWVDTEYRTIKGDRGVSGHSYGGLFAGYLLFQRPELFNRYIIASPSYWYDDNVTFDFEKAFTENNDDMVAVVYQSVGAEERSHMVTDVRRMDSLLRSRGYSGLHLKTVVVEDETHRSVFPIIFTKGIRYIYSTDPS